MTDHLTAENVELVRKALGHCLGRTFNRYEVNRIIDAARSAGPVSSGEGEPVAWPNDKPPPHWTPDDKYDRHPKTAEEWDWRQDPTGEEQLALAIRRLNFAGDLADPRAPDQMALVLRKDLINVKHCLTRGMALINIYKEKAASSAAPAPALPDEVVRLVKAARDVVNGHSNAVFGVPSLAEALEAFADRLPEDDAS